MRIMFADLLTNQINIVYKSKEGKKTIYKIRDYRKRNKLKIRYNIRRYILNLKLLYIMRTYRLGFIV